MASARVMTPPLTSRASDSSRVIAAGLAGHRDLLVEMLEGIKRYVFFFFFFVCAWFS